MKTSHMIARKRDSHPIQIDNSMALRKMLDAADVEQMDFVWVSLTGLHSRRVNRRSLKTYIVVKGVVTVAFDDETQVLREGDVCTVAPGVWCALNGDNAEIGIVCVPPFDAADEVIDEHK